MRLLERPALFLVDRIGSTRKYKSRPGSFERFTPSHRVSISAQHDFAHHSHADLIFIARDNDLGTVAGQRNAVSISSHRNATALTHQRLSGLVACYNLAHAGDVQGTHVYSLGQYGRTEKGEDGGLNEFIHIGSLHLESGHENRNLAPAHFNFAYFFPVACCQTV